MFNACISSFAKFSHMADTSASGYSPRQAQVKGTDIMLVMHSFLSTVSAIANKTNLLEKKCIILIIKNDNYNEKNKIYWNLILSTAVDKTI